MIFIYCLKTNTFNYVLYLNSLLYHFFIISILALFENINEKLKVINIKDNPRGVRVMFQSLYNEDVEVDGVFGD